MDKKEFTKYFEGVADAVRVIITNPESKKRFIQQIGHYLKIIEATEQAGLKPFDVEHPINLIQVDADCIGNQDLSIFTEQDKLSSYYACITAIYDYERLLMSRQFVDIQTDIIEPEKMLKFLRENQNELENLSDGFELRITIMIWHRILEIPIRRPSYLDNKQFIDKALEAVKHDLQQHTQPESKELQEAAKTKTEGQRQPLTPKAILIYEKLMSLKEYEGMTTPKIQDWFEEVHKQNLDEGTWKTIRKELLLWGLINARKKGYYIKK